MRRLPDLALVFLFGVFASFTGHVASAADPQCRDLFSNSDSGVKPESNLSFQSHVGQIQDLYKSIRESDSWWKSHMLYLQHLTALQKFSHAFEKMDTTTNPELGDARFQEILRRTTFRPEQMLSKDDIKFISSRKSYQFIFQNTLRTLAVGEFQLRVVQRLLHYWNGEARSLTIFHQKGFGSKFLRFIKAVYNGPIRVLIPFPTPRILMKSDRIFYDQYRNPDHQLTADQTRILEESGGTKAYLEKQKFMKERPNWTKFRRWMTLSFYGTLSLNAALVGNYSMHLGAADALVASDRFVAKAEYRLKPDQVRVYNESVPFPHMAIEMDGKVYSYGQTHMTVHTAYEYLTVENVVKARAERDRIDGRPTEPEGWLGMAYRISGLDKQPRSVQMVTLNLPKEGKDRLKRSLELSTGMRYRNNTLVLDCASMIVKALKENAGVPIPELIDASPSTVMMVLAGMKTFGATNRVGAPLVGDIKQVAMGSVDNPELHFYRNLLINSIEGKLMWFNFPKDKVHRAYFDLRYGKDNFQYLEPEVRAGIESWQKAEQDSFSEGALGDRIDELKQGAAQLGAVPVTEHDMAWADKATEFRTILDIFVDSKRSEALALVRSPDTPFDDTIKAAYRYELLNVLRTNLIAISEGQTSSAEPSPPGHQLDSVHQGKWPFQLDSTPAGSSGF